MDMETMKPRTQPMPLIYSNRDLLGFERIGNDHVPPKSKEEADLQSDAMIEQFMAAPEEMRLAQGLQSREDVEKFVGALSSDAPYIEGAWMTKHDGKYYLQYATPGTEYNIYADAVYVSDEPLGKFALARNNPYSYKPGGFMNGAGHGSTCKDKLGKYWHMASMSISKNDPMERRLGLWKAGFDSDGELWCDQRYGDWPISLDAPAFAAPDYMLLSHDSTVTATENGLVVDLGDSYDVRAIQINFEDGVILRDDFVPGFVTSYNERYIETKPGYTRWILSGSEDGKGYSLIADKSDADTDLPHDFISIDQGIRVRYLKLSDISVPYGSPMVSALRVFGPPSGEAPRVVDDVVLERTGELDMTVRWKDTSASGYNILWGYHPDKLYHSYMVFDKTEQHIGALVKGLDVYVRVDAFSKGGIAEGAVVRLK
jgi:hypothetical protein